MAFNEWVASPDVQQVTSHILPWTEILLNILADDVNAGPRLVEKMHWLSWTSTLDLQLTVKECWEIQHHRFG